MNYATPLKETAYALSQSQMEKKRLKERNIYLNNNGEFPKSTERFGYLSL